MIKDYINKEIISTPAVPGLLYGTHDHFLSVDHLPIRFQCPPCKVLIQRRDMTKLSFSLVDGSDGSDGYIETFENIIKCIYKQIEKRHKKNSITWSHIGHKNSDETYTLTVLMNPGIKVYDTIACAVFGMEDFTKEKYIECILEIEKVSLSRFYDTNKAIGYNGRVMCSILQIRVQKNPDMVDIREYPTRLSIRIDPVKDPIKGGSIKKSRGSSLENSFMGHEVFGKYFKMIQHGIPRMAVEQKLKMDGIPLDIVGKKLLDFNPGDIVPTVEPLKRTSFLEDLQTTKSTKLAHTEIQKSKKGRGHGISLAEIRKKLQSLRKTVLG
tara:strand:- start:2484 stop:3458 length:975 start_codon:yes stop_codon:yes gene_type:complete